MKKINTLNITGAVLDTKQLQAHLEKIASDHILQKKSDKKTYPIPRLEENFEYITKTYELLNSHLKIGINIHPAGEWLLDNYYMIEEAVREIKRELPLKKYRSFLGLSNGNYQGYARIYILAAEIISYTDGKLDVKHLGDLLVAYQSKKTLNMEEIWNLNVFLKIVLIENIRRICEKINSSQKQKYKVENMIERLIENKQKAEQKYKNPYNSKELGFGQMKYPFIEYMSYRLKRYGKKGIRYFNVLQEQVNKMGTTVEDVIKKEHFDIALKKISIGNCIRSIKALQTINFLEVFEEINGVEKILRKDPANIYENMDYKTKEYYRNTIEEISHQTKISEVYIANKVLELSEKHEKENKRAEKESHVGYYLVDKGKKELYQKLGVKPRGKFLWGNTPLEKAKRYMGLLIWLSVLLSIGIGIFVYRKTNLIWASIIQTVLIYLPIVEIVTGVVQYLLGKIVKPTLIPKMDFSQGIPKEYQTMVVVPTIVKSAGKVKELYEKLEVYYLANQSENLYFSLLGDCSASDKEKEDYDKEVIQAGREEVYRLNQKYPKEGLPRFQFLYRKRMWSQSEQSYIGWERKRGLLHQFNEYLLGHEENVFLYNSMEQENKKDFHFQYIITLDADTDLVLQSGLELIGAMAHILNRPKLNEEKTVVIEGHALMQPRIGINLSVSKKSKFTQIFAGNGGTDSYTNAISDVYQDNFGEGIYTGKGIYDLKVFSMVLGQAIPENCVLSHDLLEGSYLRCGLVSDVMLMDGYPFQYQAFMTRLHRWIRGDWQILFWLKKKIKNAKGNQVSNPLNLLSKFKIWDNLRRSLNEIVVIANFIFLLFSKIIIGNGFLWIQAVLWASIVLPTLIDMVHRIVSKEDGVKYQKRFDTTLSDGKASVLRGVIAILVLPHKAYMSCNAIVKTIYRIHKKQHLLEWTTAEEAEKTAKTDLASYYRWMNSNIVAGVVALLFSIGIANLYLGILGSIWLVAPIIMWYISRESVEKKPVEQISQEDKVYILDIGRKTWEYFQTYLNQENNYLPPDNYQEDRTPKIVDRTSSTNIGLAMLAIISACDLEYIEIKQAIYLLRCMLETIIKLPRWNGHLYNWYNIKTLQPLIPRYVSTVDSGNFVGYLYTTKTFLEENQATEELEMLNPLIEKTDFSVLYDKEKRLFSIGFHIEENQLTDSYYDLLASEARQASLIAIAKKDVSPKHWNSLSRTLTVFNHYKGLISWSGTAFEYLMPNVNIPKYSGSLLDESGKFMIMCQDKYAKKLGIPWGISESAFNLKDLNGNYQYKAFGIPWLGLKRGLADEMVVSSYGCILALSEVPKQVIQNLKVLEQEGMYGPYGFYESIDYTPERLPKGKTSVPVKTYMAHHQGLILLSINNMIKDGILQKRWIKNPEMKAVDILLQERMPENVVITKEKKEKVEKIKYVGYDNYVEIIYNKMENTMNEWNVIANENYTICMNQRGEGFSKYKNVYINRYKSTDEEKKGIYFYIKNVEQNQVWTSSYHSKTNSFTAHFMPDRNQYVRQDGNIKTTTKVTVAPNENVEIRSITLKNTGNQDELLEITGVMEPVLSSKEQDYAHRAYNNLFLKYDYEGDNIFVKRNGKQGEESIYLGVSFYTNFPTIGELEYEINKESFYGNEWEIPTMIKHSLPFSKHVGLVVEPIIALKRTISVPAKQQVVLNYIVAVADTKEKVEEILEEYKNNEKIQRTYELSNARVKEEARYLRISAKQLQEFQKILSYLLEVHPIKTLWTEHLYHNIYRQSDLWQYGISGNNPIILVKIIDVNDLHMAKSILKVYEFFHIKNINVDLVFVCEDENVYEQYVKNGIQAEIFDQNLAYRQNMDGGIYIFHETEINMELLLLVASLTLDARKGTLGRILKDLEEEYLENLHPIGEDKKTPQALPEFGISKPEIEMGQLTFYNEYGGFTNDGKEYIIKVNKHLKTPMAWSHVLANQKFGSIMTSNGGGFTWSKNSRLNRLTAWSNDPLIDMPSEVIYLKDQDFHVSWSLSRNPMPDENDYYITFGFGYAKTYHSCLGIIQELETYVPKEDTIKVHLLKLKNTTPNQRKIKMLYYMKPVLGEDEIKTDGYIHLQMHQEENLLCANPVYGGELSKIVYVSSSEAIASYTGSKNEFGEINNPKALNQVALSREDGLGKESCIAIEFEMELKEYESKEISILLGEARDIQIAKQTVQQYQRIEQCHQKLEEIKQYWNEILRKIQVKTPLESMNISLNGWILYQTIACRLWGRSGFYQSGGAFGFRDQLQDTIGTKYMTDEFMKEQILLSARHQFIEGDVEHWWHEETKKGIRTRFSDDLLWLVYVILEYIELTGKEDILDEQVPYLQGEILQEGEDERYEEYTTSDIVGTIYEHANKAIEKSILLGQHDLPKIGSGDWNDGFSTVGNKGVGESVWLGFFLYDILKRWIPICEKRQEEKRVHQYKIVCQKLKKALNSYAWDGKWFKRAFTDDGKILGSMQNEECRIDSIAQSWSVISNAGDNDKKYMAMDSLDNYLVNREYGIIKLLDPPFEKSDLKPGYIKNYLPGVRENGGQYTHAAIWAVIANTMLGLGDKAIEYFRMINPIEHAKTKEMAQRYKVEPYVIAADIYGAKDLTGRGGWTWYTGSSSWYYQAGIQYILGLTIRDYKLRIQPCIPKEWKEYQIHYQYGSSMYHIQVENPKGKNSGVETFVYNGQEIEEKEIKLMDNGKINEIRIVM